ncbi:hypothetical protein CHS0354_023622 [Potamilus streckersoni]|uniref:EGF-like domain-containing protein n=1 Tax=Potamilus streckersoni TaxID=2493646 RepID=A0AAE0SYQ0_9BIVA|nr:hypothetical protein CHS0354_023622 [Potamilus streckersoni]
MRNFALNKFANQSSTLNYKGFDWAADKAVDGNTNGWDADMYKTCSATAPDHKMHIWNVHLGFVVIVKRITIYGRVNKVPDQLSDFELYTDNEFHPRLTNLTSFRVQKPNNIHIFETNDHPANVISVVRRNTWILTLCEVTVEGECLDGFFSEYCNNTCGRCYNGDSCDKESGICPDGCDPGWSEMLCNVECFEGTYGHGCNKTCGNCLNGSKTCLKTNGHCIDGCKSGWQGDRCNKECEKGTYGSGCRYTCGFCLHGNETCSVVDGRCSMGCQEGWQGKNCQNECENGAYGSGCRYTCGQCLNGNETCSIVDGRCSMGCQEGWQGETCQNECENGTYGSGCRYTCGQCLNGNETCSVIDGRCSMGCQEGWQGETCQNECEKGTYGSGCSYTCGLCLNGNETCSVVDGRCSMGCQEGWQGETCQNDSSVYLIAKLSMEDITVIVGSVVGMCTGAVIISIIIIADLKKRNNDITDSEMVLNKISIRRETASTESPSNNTNTPSYYNVASLFIPRSGSLYTFIRY